MNKVKGLHIAIAVCTLLIIFVLPSAVWAQNLPVQDIAGGREEGVEVTLRADGAPKPGGSIEVFFQATPLIKAPEMVITWYIPEGVQVMDNPVETFTNSPVGQPITSQRTLTFPSPGTYKLAVSASLALNADSMTGASGVIFFVIDPLGSSVSDMEPNAHLSTYSTLPATITATPSSVEDGCFIITGRLTRLDRPVLSSGYDPFIVIPVAGQGVEVRESDLIFDDSYGTVYTDPNGNFYNEFCDDDGWFDDELEIYIQINAERGDPKVYVEDTTGWDYEYRFVTDYQSSTGGTLDFSLLMSESSSGIFNIVDAAYLARETYVSYGNEYDEETEIHWELGYGETNSHYDPNANEIFISDDPSNPSQWDESVIAHEWGHSVDDYDSCDNSPGGHHDMGQLVDVELAWGEGYPDYYQSVVRQTYGFPDAEWYLDINGSGTTGVVVNLESWWQGGPSIQNELAIAGALWDLYDGGTEFHDRVEYGHSPIQTLYTDDEFTDQDICDFDTYMQSWVNVGFPTDAATAEVIMENTGYTLSPAEQIVENPERNFVSAEPNMAELYRWWKLLTYVADNSYSMTGPEFEAMKVVFQEAVNDLGDDPAGTEFTLDLFNNTSSTNYTAFAGQFFAEELIDPIGDLTTQPEPDPSCNVFALRALAQAVADQNKGDVWLFTDGNTVQNPSVQDIRQLLTDNQMRASIALMGGCFKEQEQDLLQPFSPEILEGLSAEEQQALMNERLALSQARGELGPMVDDAPGGAVPYLLTALNSGGQFLYVAPDQLENAADVLRAQITNSAGAGNWSDYVSDYPTYGWEALASWDFHWIDATVGGINRGNPLPNQELAIPIPGYFQYYSGPYFDTIHIFEDGYAVLGLDWDYVPNNTTLPNPAPPNGALYPMWDDLAPFCVPGESAAQDYCEGFIFTKQEGEWYAIEFYKYYHYYDLAQQLNNFEILLNLDTGEIRYQYQTVPNASSSSTIGLEDFNGESGLQVLYDSSTAPANNTAYKMTPLPPQPTLTYTVTVDSSMDAVGFLLTGYSGDFEPLEITDPNGSLIDCDDPSALCLDIDLIQYVQVNTYGRNGAWHAVVDAGPSGASTFSFTSFAASPITVQGGLNHTLATGNQQFNVHLTGQVDGNILDASFRRLNGQTFGSGFHFYDDGLHNDHAAGDGIFGSGNFYPPGTGTAYLTLHGLHDGEAFVRNDPVPYTFSPFKMVSLGDGANYGGATQLQYRVTNLDIYDHCYWLTYEAPEGWWMDFNGTPWGCLYAGQTVDVGYNVYMAEGNTNDLPSGTTGMVTLSAIEWEKGLIQDSASARITRHREPDQIDITNYSFFIRPNGDSIELKFMVTDVQNALVVDGTPLHLTANGGTIIPATGLTENGVVTATFTSGPAIGTAYVYAQTDNFVVSSTSIKIANPMASTIELQMSTNQLPADGTSLAVLTATVRDRWGNPVANQLVRIGVGSDSDEDALGTIDGGEVASGVTDAYGRFSAKFTNNGVVGKAAIRAEMYIMEGEDLRVIHQDQKMMYVGMHLVHLPLIMR